MLFRILCLVLALWATVAHAAQADSTETLPVAPPGTGATLRSSEATLTYFHRPIVTFRSALLGVSAGDRVGPNRGRAPRCSVPCTPTART